MELKLAGRRALVTGSSSGIGRGIATVLAREGVVVVVHGRNRARTEDTARMICAAGGTAPPETVPDYCAAKAGIINMSVSLSKALARSGVTVNKVSPGWRRPGRLTNFR